MHRAMHLEASNDVHYVMSDVMKFFYKKVMDRAVSLAHYTKSKSIEAKHIQAAIEFSIGGDLVNQLHYAGGERVEKAVEWNPDKATASNLARDSVDPNEWERMRSSTSRPGQHYYLHKVSGEKSWDRPSNYEEVRHDH